MKAIEPGLTEVQKTQTALDEARGEVKKATDPLAELEGQLEAEQRLDTNLSERFDAHALAARLTLPTTLKASGAPGASASTASA